MNPDLARLLDEVEARQLPALIADWTERDGYRWIARALRLDLPLLIDRPELVMPCLYRRLAWLDAYHVSPFFARAAPPPHDAADVYPIVHPWFASVLADRRWLRSLRPSPLPVDAAIVEEYRTGLEGELRFSDDASVIAIVGEHATVAWERVTGRRVEPPRLAAVRAPRGWQVDREAGAGRLVVVRDAERIGFDIDQWHSVGYLRELSDTLVIAIARDGDDDGVYYVVDLAARKIVATGQGHPGPVACSPSGDRVYVGFADDGLEVHWTRERRTATWHGPGVRALAVAADGTVATRDGHVIRIWEHEHAEARDVRFRARDEGPAGMWSPDGSRVVTHRLLCDGDNGRFVAELPLRIGGWLEGGPPEDCWRIGDGVFVEVMPMGLRVWDTSDGRLVVDDRARGASHDESIAFDPGCRWYACHDRRGEITVTSLLRGDVVFRHVPPRADRWRRALRLSDDGARLWFETEADTWWLATLADGSVRPLVDGELPDEPPAPARAVVRDGLLVVDDVALPYDEPHAIASPDGRRFAYRASHVGLVEGW